MSMCKDLLDQVAGMLSKLPIGGTRVKEGPDDNYDQTTDTH